MTVSVMLGGISNYKAPINIFVTSAHYCQKLQNNCDSTKLLKEIAIVIHLRQKWYKNQVYNFSELLIHSHVSAQRIRVK